MPPRFEALRLFFTKDGIIVGESGYSSRLPASAALHADIRTQVTADKTRFGADGYYLLHNHPSGKANPSAADVAFTRMVQKDVDGFRGTSSLPTMNTASSTMTASKPDHLRRAELLREMDSQMFRDVK